LTTTQANQHSSTAHPPSSHAPLLVCGGGTGGHVYPALAVAQELGDRRLLYVGSRDGMEAALVARESDLPFYGLPAAALRGRNPLAMARAGLVLGAGVLHARQLLRELRPAAILGTGGYVCVPLFVAARAAGVPTAIYLPDVVPGLAVKALARLATMVACNVEDSAPYFAKPIAVVGYPVRRELWTQDKAACRASFALEAEPPVLLVYGGSRGARSINRAVQVLLPWLLERAQVIHVCGREGDEGWLREAAAALPRALQRRYHLYPYLFGDEVSGPTMTQAFGAADVALCRSGASTLAELPAAGLPAMLVPYPYVHQDENADYLVQRGAAVKVGDDQLPGLGKPGDGTLERELGRLLANDAARDAIAQRSKALAKHDAAQRLAELLLGLAGRK
jgi:UDP-N-acetylglucosamine--N-acetylmuramyl-(pentapeptide) pyrophosphoryl-undecaprenol N-acetylglucosamine transferase